MGEIPAKPGGLMPAQQSGVLRLRDILHRGAVLFVAVCVFLSPLSAVDRTKLKPGVNMFSTTQEIQLGEKLSKEVAQQYPLLKDQRVDDYLNTLGHQLAAFAPGPKYPYEFHCVNSKEIDAFALPGGFIYVDRGVIEEAHDEAQLAGVLAHEISHVALRHGTNQATKQQIWGTGINVLGGVIGGSAVGAIASQLGESLAASTILLKYSRTAESQADVLGIQILYDAGYDPRALVQFFEAVEFENKGKKPIQFFSDHPAPENRIDRLNEEMERLGGLPQNYSSDSAAFRDIRRLVLSLPLPPALGPRFLPVAPPEPASPSRTLRDYIGATFSAKYPDNWEAYGQGDAVSLVPRIGVVKDAQGNPGTAYGVIVDIFQPPQWPGTPNGVSLNAASDQLLAGLQQSNPNLEFAGRQESIDMDGVPAVSMKLVSVSPLGGQENDWLVAVLRPQGLLYFICVAPANNYEDYDPSFQKIIASVHLNR
jgi:Zn-dependent protease with chaperone function